ncbi:MAG: glycosyltransferase [Thermoproteus sp. AZ2]|jgi:cellulose synthase/poly-beta-1,6-N-acetylglucosamine synthase-like glycosyltransferase|uniref:Glycosyltransferase n=1 Tax=Thermoproteus sp. AZ2 TaxID=1609232 RepID=A0ACC6V0X8_9CREN|nr:MAG: glycosyl transferase family 2 [Thermoproteus sp. AZ2]
MLFLVLLMVGSIVATWHLTTTLSSSEPKLDVRDGGRDGVYVVIPSCRDENLFETIGKWLSQLYSRYKVVVVEDCGEKSLISSFQLKHIGSVETPRRVDVYVGDKLIVLEREGRIGLKAGALNDAVRALSILRPLGDAKYVIFVDSDHEPSDLFFISRAVALIKKFGVDLLQGVQRHLYLGSSLDALVSTSHDISGTMLVGRTRLRMMPIFTGSTAIARLEPIAKLGFREDTVTEDFDLSVRMWLSGYAIAATWNLYTWGRPPRNLKAYFKQQLRWSSGTIRTFLRYFVPVITSDMSLRRKLDFVFQGTVFASGVLYVAIIIATAYKLITGAHFSVAEIALLAYMLASGLAIDLYVESKYHTPAQPDILAPFLEFVTAFVHIGGTLLGALGREYGWIRTARKFANAAGVGTSQEVV